MKPNRYHILPLAVLLSLWVGPARAIEEPPRPPTSVLGKIRDLAATVRARRVLEQDGLLSRLNLGVEVENGVATVWGPIPSAAVARQAVARLEKVSGVLEVKPNFYFDQRQESLLGGLAVAGDGPLRIDAAKPDSDTGRLPDPPRRTDTTLAGSAVSRPDPPAIGRGNRPGVPQMFAPRPVAGRPGEARVVSAPVRRSLAQQVAAVQQSDARFRSIRVRVEGRTVVIVRGDQDDGEVMALFRKLRDLRDVNQVLLTDE